MTEAGTNGGAASAQPLRRIALLLRQRDTPHAGNLNRLRIGGDRSVSTGDIELAVDHEDRLHLLIPVYPDSVIVPDRSVQGITLGPLTLDSHKAGAQHFLDIACTTTETSLESIFLDALETLVDRLVRNPEGAASVPFIWLEDARQMFKRSSRVRFTERCLGLYGELLLLEELGHRMPHRAIDCWLGPSRAPHDFVGNATEIEVKATLNRNDRRAEINELYQLDPTPGRDLWLSFIRLREDDDRGRSLDILVDAIAGAGVDRQELERLIGDYGLDPHELPPDRLAVVEWRCFPVVDGFPRLTAAQLVDGSLEPGVSRVRYSINLDVVEEWLDSDELVSRFVADVAKS